MIADAVVERVDREWEQAGVFGLSEENVVAMLLVSTGDEEERCKSNESVTKTVDERRSPTALSLNEMSNGWPSKSIVDFSGGSFAPDVLEMEGGLDAQADTRHPSIRKVYVLDRLRGIDFRYCR